VRSAVAPDLVLCCVVPTTVCHVSPAGAVDVGKCWDRSRRRSQPPAAAVKVAIDARPVRVGITACLVRTACRQSAAAENAACAVRTVHVVRAVHAVGLGLPGAPSRTVSLPGESRWKWLMREKARRAALTFFCPDCVHGMHARPRCVFGFCFAVSSALALSPPTSPSPLMLGKIRLEPLPMRALSEMCPSPGVLYLDRLCEGGPAVSCPAMSRPGRDTRLAQ